MFHPQGPDVSPLPRLLPLATEKVLAHELNFKGQLVTNFYCFAAQDLLNELGLVLDYHVADKSLGLKLDVPLHAA